MNRPDEDHQTKTRQRRSVRPVSGFICELRAARLRGRMPGTGGPIPRCLVVKRAGTRLLMQMGLAAGVAAAHHIRISACVSSSD